MTTLTFLKGFAAGLPCGAVLLLFILRNNPRWLERIFNALKK